MQKMSSPDEEPPFLNSTATAASASALSALTLEDPLASKYGEITEEELVLKDISGRNWMQLSDRYEDMKGVTVWIIGDAEAIRADEEEETAFVFVRDCCLTVQCVVRVARDLVSPQMVKFAKSIRRESMVVIEGVVSDPEKAFILEASEEVEIQVTKLYCLKGSIPIPTLPEPIDAARTRSDDIKLAKACWRFTLTLGKQVLAAKHNRDPGQSPPRDDQYLSRELVLEDMEVRDMVETADALLRGDKSIDLGVESARRAAILVIDRYLNLQNSL